MDLIILYWIRHSYKRHCLIYSMILKALNNKFSVITITEMRRKIEKAGYWACFFIRTCRALLFMYFAAEMKLYIRVILSFCI